MVSACGMAVPSQSSLSPDLNAWARSRYRLDANKSVVKLADVARITAVRSSAADRVDRLDADREIDIGAAVGIEGVVAGEVQFGAGLPPTVPRRDDAVRQGGVEPGARARPRPA